MSEPALYPLTFEPLYKELVWGGRRLESVLGKDLPPVAPIGESWELVDLPTDQSCVANGPLAGTTLEALVKVAPNGLLGPAKLDVGRFPLLVKYIDAAKTLSVQVHPDDETAAKLGGRAKSEAWYILDAAPDAALYLGLKEGVNDDDFRAAIHKKTLEELLVRVAAKPGDLIPVRPGTVHAIGAGVLLAEVQQPSNTTYRIYDWGRVGLDGKPRELHIEQALAATDLAARPAIGELEYDAGHFRLRVLELAAARQRQFELKNAGPIVLVGLAGSGQLKTSRMETEQVIDRGRVILLPNGCRPAYLETEETACVMVVSFA